MRLIRSMALAASTQIPSLEWGMSSPSRWDAGGYNIRDDGEGYDVDFFGVNIAFVGHGSGPRPLERAKHTAQEHHVAYIRAALEAGQLCNSTVEMAECAAFSAGYEAGERDGRARPMCEAPKDGTPVLVKIKDDLSPWGVNQSNFSNTHLFCGLYAVMRNRGDIQDWGFAAPVGRGGFPDEWLDGWWPLPHCAALAKGGA